MNWEQILQSLIGISVAALVADHIVLRTRIATFVTADKLTAQVREIEVRIDNRMAELSEELRKIAIDLAFLRGKSGG